jgi:hypothetical protein
MNLIIDNQANLGHAGMAGSGGGATGGQGGTSNGSVGQATPGIAGTIGANGMGEGGGVFRASGANVTINNTQIAGNSASTSGSDVFNAPGS